MPGFRIVNSSTSVDCNPHSDFPFKIKPDVSVYCADSDPDVLTDTSLAEIFIEFKWSPADDPFCDVCNIQCGNQTATTFLRGSKLGDDTLGQITFYASAQLGSQFRTHIYSVFIVRTKARILRWDRSGAVVTEAIDYNQSPLLAEFFRRYSKAPADMRGIDGSVSNPTSKEASAARQALGLDASVPLAKLEIPSNGGAPHYFITSTPRATLYTPPGRATRGFRAYDTSQATLVFLKDTWRVDLPDIQAEGLTYEVLSAAHVPHIPECIAYGDISTATYHATKTASLAAAQWACRTDAHIVPHRHYRLALNVVGRSLLAFESSYQMVGAVRDAIIGRLNDPITNEQH
jgi:hypothetical protein